MRKMIIINTGYDDVFFDETGEHITSIHENDGNWRSEYMNCLMKHFGVGVEHQEAGDFVNEDKYNEMLNTNYEGAVKMLIEAVKKNKGKKNGSGKK